jgi:hypothetical protein
MEFISKSLPSTNPLFGLMHHMPMKPCNPRGNKTTIPILSPLSSHFLMQSTSMLSQKRCNLFPINETSWIVTYLASSQTTAWWMLELEIKHKHGGFNINYEKATVVWQQFG